MPITGYGYGWPSTVLIVPWTVLSSGSHTAQAGAAQVASTSPMVRWRNWLASRFVICFFLSAWAAHVPMLASVGCPNSPQQGSILHQQSLRHPLLGVWGDPSHASLARNQAQLRVELSVPTESATDERGPPWSQGPPR